jgi:hypothetical protein
MFLDEQGAQSSSFFKRGNFGLEAADMLFGPFDLDPSTSGPIGHGR